MKILYLIPLFIILFGIGLIVYSVIKDGKLTKKRLTKNTKCKYAILIPARNESAVIEDLLKSLSVQTDLKDTYVIVEKSSDKTCKIAQKYGANVYVRNVTKETKRKGYALDECIKDILKKKKKYDLYFIFDADNIVDRNFIKEMLETYKQGYQIGTGYRNIKNNDNVYATCSGLTFTCINSFFNERKNRSNKSGVIMGTGYYIAGELIEKWQGFPFHSLTEDYELTLYCSKENISTYYNEKAVFYDEQPTNMKTSITQRTRWVKGYLENQKKMYKKIKEDKSKALGIIPYLIIIIGFALYLAIILINFIVALFSKNMAFGRYPIYFLLILLILYLILFMITFFIIIKEIERLNMPAVNTLKALFFNPIFLSTYLICFFKALKTKDLEWQEISHNKTMS